MGKRGPIGGAFFNNPEPVIRQFRISDRFSAPAAGWQKRQRNVKNTVNSFGLHG
jgi:hypothetical protein